MIVKNQEGEKSMDRSIDVFNGPCLRATLYLLCFTVQCSTYFIYDQIDSRNVTHSKITSAISKLKFADWFKVGQSFTFDLKIPAGIFPTQVMCSFV